MAETTMMEKDIVGEFIDEAFTNETLARIEEVSAKPYKFRKLKSTDVFLMFKIIGAIGVNNFTKCIESESVLKVIKEMTEEEKGSDAGAYAAVGAVVLEAANVIFFNIGRCENEIYQLLAQTSNLTIEEIKAEGNAVMFFEMVIDFLKKEEFPDFIKAVSKLFK